MTQLVSGDSVVLLKDVSRIDLLTGEETYFPKGKILKVSWYSWIKGSVGVIDEDTGKDTVIYFGEFMSVKN